MKKSRIFLFLLLLVVIILIWYFVCQVSGKKRPPVLLRTASGLETTEFQLHDSIIFDAVNLPPRTGLRIQVAREDGKVMTESVLSTDRFGRIPETVIWYDIGIIPCFQKLSERTEIITLSKKEIYDLTIVGKQYFVNIFEGEKLVRKTSFSIVERLEVPRLYAVDSRGCPRSWFLIGEEDIYVVGENFPKGSIIRLWIVPDDTDWRDGDELKDMTKQYPNNTPIIFELKGDETEFKRLLWPRLFTSIGSYDIVAEVVTYPFGAYRVFPVAKAEDVISNLTFAGFIVQRRQEAGEPLEMNLSASRQSQLVHRDHFLTTDDVYVYFNPAIHSNFVGQYADVYIVPDQPEAQWVNDPFLQNKDVTGTVEHILIQSCGNCFQANVWSNPLIPGNYDVVLDFNSNARYDSGTDLIDSLDEVGFIVHSSVPSPTIPGPVCDGDFYVKVCTTIGSSTVKVYRNGTEIANAIGNGGCVFINLDGTPLNIGDNITAQQFHSAGNSPVSSAISVTSGGSPAYDTSLWNDPAHQFDNNCYNYGCDIMTGTYAQPGRAHGIYLSYANLNCADVTNAAKADSLAETPNKICSECTHIIALVIDPGSDYHWYRLDRNGRWSHKLASNPATDRDASGNLITNPETTNRDYTADYYLNYSVFCGYFCVDKTKVSIQ